MSVWHGQALEVDLANGRCATLPLSSEVLHQTLGGRGLAGYLLRLRSAQLPDQNTPLIAFACGPLCGSDIQTADRLVAVFRSPLTRGVFDNSSGCSFAPALKRCGFDALVLKGSAPVLSQLRIDTDGAILTQVPALAGLKCEQTLLELNNDAALVIGPAGEHRVRFASVIASDGEPLERGGLGAVFGQMNLKALCCQTAAVSATVLEDVCTSSKADIQRLCHASPFLYGPLGIGACGTAALLDLTQARQMLPTANFQRSSFAHTAEFSAAQLRKRDGYAADACPGCAIGCRKKDATGTLPEYDSLAHFSALLCGRDLNTVIEADRCCRSLGMDPVSSAVVLAAFFAQERKSSPPLNWKHFLEQIALRRAAGAALADGLKLYLAQQTHPQACYAVKGLEMPGFDPRGAYGLALSLALSTAGDYRHAMSYHHELLRKPVPTERFSFAGKARIIMQAEDAVAACDSLAVCRHTLIAAGLEEYAALLTAVTGTRFDAAGLAASGRQTVMRERWLNQQYGFSAADDLLPEPFFAQTAEAGYAPSPLNLADFMTERSRYYRLRGLDTHGRCLASSEEPL